MSRGIHARVSKVDCPAVAEQQLIWLGRHMGSRAGRRRLSLGWPRVAGTSRIITRLRSPDYSFTNTNIAHESRCWVRNAHREATTRPPQSLRRKSTASPPRAWSPAHNRKLLTSQGQWANVGVKLLLGQGHTCQHQALQALGQAQRPADCALCSKERAATYIRP